LVAGCFVVVDAVDEFAVGVCVRRVRRYPGHHRVLRRMTDIIFDGAGSGPLGE
jgi:hypothetical protein